MVVSSWEKKQKEGEAMVGRVVALSLQGDKEGARSPTCQWLTFVANQTAEPSSRGSLSPSRRTLSDESNLALGYDRMAAVRR